MKQKDQIDERLNKPGEVNRTDENRDKTTMEPSQGTVAPRSASHASTSELRRLTYEDYKAIYAVLEHLKGDYQEFRRAKGKLPAHHIGHALKRLDRLLWWFE